MFIWFASTTNLRGPNTKVSANTAAEHSLLIQTGASKRVSCKLMSNAWPAAMEAAGMSGHAKRKSAKQNAGKQSSVFLRKSLYSSRDRNSGDYRPPKARTCSDLRRYTMT